jgi:16S rRNA (cytidine1402-2'-O)-methyltransferase
MVFYESSHRILQTLTDMQHVLGADRQAVMARELTKTFETVIPETLARLVEIVAADSDQQRGEFVVMVAGAEDRPDTLGTEVRRVLDAFAGELSPNRLAKVAAKLYGGNKRDYYQYLLERK